MWYDGQAYKLALQGKDGSRMASRIRLQFGLTAREEEVLKAIAADSRTRVGAMVATAQSMKSAGTPAGSPQLQNLLSQRKQVALDHIQQLTAAFGPSRFSQLDRQVRATTFKQAGRAAPGGPLRTPPTKRPPGY
jgi:hypothetical protein